ncbi:hypothetical protein MTO96_041431 [Rhipicephalus appendiculatus]
MAAWNEFLFAAQLQLREIPGAHGMLALVNFDDPTTFVDQPQDLQGLNSAAAMHHLLKHHQCVASLSIGTLHFQKYIQPLRDALPYSHLKKLRMTCMGSLMTDGLWAALPSLTSLEELDCSFSSCCSNHRCVELSDALVTLVRTSPSLAVLCLAGITMEKKATKNLLASLNEKGVLRDLTLGMWVIPRSLPA